MRVAGETALQYFRKNLEVTTKDDNSPVSEADYAADAVLKHQLLGPFPDYGWISEESASLQGKNCDRTWIVDPIDGTRAFLNGKEDWCVSVALLENRRPALAAIFLPCSGDLYEGCAGQGAYLNNERLTTSRKKSIEGCCMVGYRDLFRSKKWARPWPSMTVEIYNSMAIRLARVADGRCDAALTLNAKSDWDLAAADLLVQEAGGMITDIQGLPFRYGQQPLRKPNVLASGAMLHSKLVVQTCAWNGRISLDSRR